MNSQESNQLHQLTISIGHSAPHIAVKKQAMNHLSVWVGSLLQQHVEMLQKFLMQKTKQGNNIISRIAVKRVLCIINKLLVAVLACEQNSQFCKNNFWIRRTYDARSSIAIHMARNHQESKKELYKDVVRCITMHNGCSYYINKYIWSHDDMY